MSRSKRTNKNRRARKQRPTDRATKLTPHQRLQNASEVLNAVRHAAEDFQEATTVSRAKTAVRNFLEQGRSVTWALEHLKSNVNDEADWNAWWTATTVELRGDPIAQWFYALRNPIVKEGHPVEIHQTAYLKGPVTLPPPNEERPEGATGWGLDSTLTPFWEMADGTQIPAQPIPGVQRWNALAETPEPLRNRPLTELMQHYIVVLERILAAAIGRFGLLKD